MLHLLLARKKRGVATLKLITGKKTIQPAAQKGLTRIGHYFCRTTMVLNQQLYLAENVAQTKFLNNQQE